MLDPRRLRTELDALKKGLTRRGIDTSVLDKAADLDERQRQAIGKRDELRARVNALSKEVGEAFKAGDKATGERKREESKTLGEEEHQAFDELLVVRAESEDGHAVVEDAHDEAADHGACDGSNTTRDGGAADEGRRDGVQLEAGAARRLRRVQPGGEYEAGQGSEDAHVHEEPERDGPCLDAGEFRGVAIGHQEAEQAAGFDGAELAVIPDQDEFGVGGFHRFDQGGEVRGGQHGGLVDDHDLTPAELGGGITALAAPVEELGDRLGGNPGFFGQHPSRHGRNGQASQLGPVVRPGVPSGAKH